MLDELQWPTLEAQRDQSSLLFFHKIYCGTLSIDKDKYLTPSQSTRSAWSSHNSQYCRPQTYSDALKYSFFFPRTIPHWNSLAPSVVAVETTEEFRALILVLQISRLSEGSTGQIFATSSVIYQIKMWGL